MAMCLDCLEGSTSGAEESVANIIRLVAAAVALPWWCGAHVNGRFIRWSFSILVGSAF